MSKGKVNVQTKIRKPGPWELEQRLGINWKIDWDKTSRRLIVITNKTQNRSKQSIIKGWWVWKWEECWEMQSSVDSFGGSWDCWGPWRPWSAETGRQVAEMTWQSDWRPGLQFPGCISVPHRCLIALSCHVDWLLMDNEKDSFPFLCSMVLFLVCFSFWFTRVCLVLCTLFAVRLSIGCFFTTILTPIFGSV